jgi:hypothetical protein
MPRVSGQQGEIRNSATPPDRIAKLQQFHLRAAEKTGLLIPLYIYPANVHTNKDFQSSHRAQAAILRSSVLGHRESGIGPRHFDRPQLHESDRPTHRRGMCRAGLRLDQLWKGPRSKPCEARHEKTWQKFLPEEFKGIFFDEMLYEDNDDCRRSIKSRSIKQHTTLGFWPTVANPGTDTPGRYLCNAESADVIVIHESERMANGRKAPWQLLRRLLRLSAVFASIADVRTKTVERQRCANGAEVHTLDLCDSGHLQTRRRSSSQSVGSAFRTSGRTLSQILNE